MKKSTGFSLVIAVAFSGLFTMCNNPQTEEQTETPEVIEQTTEEVVPAETATETTDSTAAPAETTVE